MNNSFKFMMIFIFSQMLMLTFSASAKEAPRVIHAFVALCDNEHQGIVPVPAKLGDGNDAKNNLYWGALYGIKTFFKKSPNWKLVKSLQLPPPVIERCIFKHKRKNVFFVADAYNGRLIKQAVIDFLDAASGKSRDSVSAKLGSQNIEIKTNGDANLVVYVGHNGLMDFSLERFPEKQDNNFRESIILACFSKSYFYDAIISAGTKPLLWTTGLMAPEAYTLENALEGWVLQESDEKIHLRAAEAYNKYQKCGLRAAKRLLVHGL